MGLLSGYLYRRSFTLSRASGSVSNYQMRLLVGESSGSFSSEVYSNNTTWDALNTGWSNTTARYIFPGSDIIGSANHIKIKLTRYTSDWSFSKMYIGEKATSGDAYDFASTPRQVTFSSGQAGGTVTSSGLTSDPIPFRVDKHKDYIISIYFSSYSEPPKKDTAASGYALYYKEGDDAATVDASGYSASASNGKKHFVEKIYGYSVHCGGLCKSDFSDLRFTKSDGTTLLDYWIESVAGTTPNQLATVWIEFDSIGTTDTIFYMYYGNASATAVSNASNTFVFFDHFDSGSEPNVDNWYHFADNGSETVSESIFTITGHASYNAWGCKQKYGTNYSFRMRAKVPGDGTYGTDSGIGIDDRSDDGTYVGTGFDQARLNLGISKSWTTSREGTPYSPERTDMVTDYSIVDISRNGSSNVKFYINDSLKLTSSTYVPLDTMGFFFYTDHASQLIYVDWVAVRKYETTEPVWGTWGGTELLTSSSTTPTISKIMGVSSSSLSKFMGVQLSSIKKIFGKEYSGSVLSYGIWNPNDKGSNITVTNKNLTAIGNGSWHTIRTTIAKTSGKYYCEMIPNNSNNGEYCIVGVAGPDASLTSYIGNNNYSWGWWGKSGQPTYYHNASPSNHIYSFTNNDVLMIAIDIDNHKLWFGKNGTWNGSPAGDPANGLYAVYSDLDVASYYFAASLQYTNSSMMINCGQIPFVYTPPSGFSALTAPPSWFSTYDQTGSWTYENNGANMNFRMIYSGSEMNMSGSKIRLTIKAHNTQNQYIGGVSIGERNGSTIGMISVPTRVTFDGGNSDVTILAGVDKVSDEIDFEIDETKQYLVHVFHNAGASSYYAYAYTGGRYYIVSNNDDTMVQTPTGYNTSQVSGYTGFISKIEVYSATPTSYATWNPNDKGSSITLSNKNNVATKSGSNSDYTNSGIRSTIGKSSGKWYFEYVYTEDGGSNWPVVGVGNLSANMSDHVGSDTNSWGIYAQDGYKYHNDVGSSYGTSFVQGDIIGVALDMDNGKVWFSKNGTWMNSGDPAAGTNEAFSGLTGTIYAFIVVHQPSSIWTANFGATGLTYTPPSGFKSGLYS